MEKPDRKIAILVDGDNAQPRLIKAIIEEVSKYGKVTIRRIYGDWTDTRMGGWKEALNDYSFNPIQKFSYTKGKNSTDGALIIDAMDILHDDIVSGFCIVSSDSDYTGLAKRIREEGVFVMGIGRKITPMAFVKSCEIFTYCETIDPESEKPAPAKAKQSRKKTATADNKEKAAAEVKPIAKIKSDKAVMRLINKAFEMSQNEDDRAFISQIGFNIRKLDPSFDTRTYGFRNLTHLFEEIPGYEVLRNENGNPLVRQK